MNDPFGYQSVPDFQQAPPPSLKQSGSGLATASMILGIVTTAVCCYGGILILAALVTGILAIVFAAQSKKQGNGVLNARAKIGLILGIVGLALFLVLLTLYAVSIVLMLTDSQILETVLTGLEYHLSTFGIDFDPDSIIRALS